LRGVFRSMMMRSKFDVQVGIESRWIPFPRQGVDSLQGEIYSIISEIVLSRF
jgi:hypothetical protein